MNSESVNIYSVLIAYVYVIIALVISKLTGIKKEKLIFISGFRMTLQLLITAYVLQMVFDNPKVIYTVMILLVMEIFAIYNIRKRSGIKSLHFTKTIAISMVAGSLLCLIYFILMVIKLKPWYNPQYIITLGGMLIGNTMTALTLAINSLTKEIKSQRVKIEGALMLGASPHDAVDENFKNALNASILPTMNSMLGMGIVFLPGMMAGQIISGESPLTAIFYQISIMLGIFGSVVISTFLFLEMARKLLFNKDAQLRLDELE